MPLILSSPPAADPAPAERSRPAAGSTENVLLALLDALSSPERYRLVAYGGELYVEATGGR